MCYLLRRQQPCCRNMNRRLKVQRRPIYKVSIKKHVVRDRRRERGRYSDLGVRRLARELCVSSLPEVCLAKGRQNGKNSTRSKTSRDKSRQLKLDPTKNSSSPPIDVLRNNTCSKFSTDFVHSNPSNSSLLINKNANLFYTTDIHNFLSLDSTNSQSNKLSNRRRLVQKHSGKNIKQNKCDKSRANRTTANVPSFLKILFFTYLINIFTVVAAADDFERSIAAVFNKVAYGSSTTKRSIPENLSVPQLSTLATPLLTTYRYRDGNEEFLRVDVDTNPNRHRFGEDIGSPQEEELPIDLDTVKERRHHHKNHHHGISYELDLEKDHALPTSAPNAEILKGNNNKHYSNPNRYSNDRSRHNLKVYGRDDYPKLPEGVGRDIPGSIRTYPETRRPSSLLETDSGKIASTQSSYNLLRNINPTQPMHRGELPSYSPPSRSYFTPPLPPEFKNQFADTPTLKGTNSAGNNYQNKRPLPPPSIMPKQDRIPFRPDLPQSATGNVNTSAVQKNIGAQTNADPDNRKIFSGSSDGKKKVLNTPSQNVNLDRLGEFSPHTPINESQFEYDSRGIFPSIRRILSGSNGKKDEIPDVLLRTVTAKPNLPLPFPSTKRPPEDNEEFQLGHQQPHTTKRLHESSSVPKYVDDPDDLDELDDDDDLSPHIVEEKPGAIAHAQSTTQPNKNPDETTLNIEHDIQNLPNVNRDRNNFQIYSTKSTFLNSTTRDDFYTWNVFWNLHVYLTAILYTLLAVYSIYKIIRYDKLTHLFSQSYFIIVHLLLTTICVSRIFYLIYDPYNINLSFHKFISDIFLNLPLSFLAIAFATVVCYFLKRTINKTHFKVRPVFVIIFSFVHILLCITLHLLESFDVMGKNNHVLSLVCQFIYILLCLFLGFVYLYLYKIIKKVLAKKSQNFSELSIQNLSYATHITIAIALVFLVLSGLLIYGIFGIASHENFSHSPPYKWLAWGFQFSIRLIEISVIALLSWVVSLKLSIREKTIDNNTRFVLFPCANSNSTVDNEIYPAICQTNQNVHNFTLRSGKSIYDDNFPLNNMDGIPSEVIGRPNLGAPTNSDRSSFERTSSNFERNSNSNFERGINHFDHAHQHSLPSQNNFDRTNYERGSASNFERVNNFERSNYERNSNTTGRMTPQQFERNNYERSSNVRNFERGGHFSNSGRADSNQALNCFDNRYMEDQNNSDDHYENPDFEVEHTFRRSKRAAHEKYAPDNLDTCSGSSRSNSVMGTKMGQFNEQGLYNEPVDQEYNFQSYERPNFERPSSRTNSNYGSKHVMRSEKRSNSSSSGNSAGTFERRSMRKSGTLNDFSERGKHGGSGHGYHRNGVQTLNSVQKVHTYGQKMPMNDELSDSMLVDENGFVRFRNLGNENAKQLERSKRTNSKNREHKNKNMFNNS